MKIQRITKSKNGTYIVKVNEHYFYRIDGEYMSQFGEPSLENHALIDALRKECAGRASIYLPTGDFPE